MQASCFHSFHSQRWSEYPNWWLWVGKKVVWRHLDCPLRWYKVCCRYVSFQHWTTYLLFVRNNTDKPPTASLTLYVLGKAILVKYFWVGSWYWRSRISVISQRVKQHRTFGEIAGHSSGASIPSLLYFDDLTNAPVIIRLVPVHKAVGKANCACWPTLRGDHTFVVLPCLVVTCTLQHRRMASFNPLAPQFSELAFFFETKSSLSV